MTKPTNKPEISDQTKTCALCGSSTTYIDKSKWDFLRTDDMPTLENRFVLSVTIEPTGEKVR